jgi:hypothetical protein
MNDETEQNAIERAAWWLFEQYQGVAMLIWVLRRFSRRRPRPVRDRIERVLDACWALLDEAWATAWDLRYTALPRIPRRVLWLLRERPHRARPALCVHHSAPDAPEPAEPVSAVPEVYRQQVEVYADGDPIGFTLIEDEAAGVFQQRDSTYSKSSSYAWIEQALGPWEPYEHDPEG